MEYENRTKRGLFDSSPELTFTPTMGMRMAAAVGWSAVATAEQMYPRITSGFGLRPMRSSSAFLGSHMVFLMVSLISKTTGEATLEYLMWRGLAAGFLVQFRIPKVASQKYSIFKPVPQAARIRTGAKGFQKTQKIDPRIIKKLFFYLGIFL